MQLQNIKIYFDNAGHLDAMHASYEGDADVNDYGVVLSCGSLIPWARVLRIPGYRDAVNALYEKCVVGDHSSCVVGQ